MMESEFFHARFGDGELKLDATDRFPPSVEKLVKPLFKEILAIAEKHEVEIMFICPGELDCFLRQNIYAYSPDAAKYDGRRKNTKLPDQLLKFLAIVRAQHGETGGCVATLFVMQCDIDFIVTCKQFTLEAKDFISETMRLAATWRDTQSVVFMTEIWMRKMNDDGTAGERMDEGVMVSWHDRARELCCIADVDDGKLGGWKVVDHSAPGSVLASARFGPIFTKCKEN